MPTQRDYSKYRNLKAVLQGDGADDINAPLVMPPASEDSPEAIAAADAIDRSAGPGLSNDHIAGGFDSIKPEDADIVAQAAKEAGEPTQLASRSLPPGFKTVSAAGSLPPGFKSVKKDSLPQGFKSVLPDGFKAVKQEPNMEQDSFLQGLSDRAEGTGRQMVDWATSGPRMLGGLYKGLGTQAAGGSPQEGVEAAGQLMNDTSVQGGYPTNPAMDSVLEGITAVAKGAKDSFNDTLDKSNKIVGNPPQDKYENPMAEFGIGTLANLAPMAAGRKAASDYIDANFRKVDDSVPKLPNPKAQLAEQANFTEQRNGADMAQYNANPAKFGVDEIGARNPYDTAGTVSGEAELRTDPADGFSNVVNLNADSVGANTPEHFKLPQPAGPYLLEILDRNGSDARTVGKALNVVMKYSQEPFERDLASRILNDNENMSNVPITFLDKKGEPAPHGTTSFAGSTIDKVTLYSDLAKDDYTGMTPQVIIHEALHVRTFHDLTIGNYILNLEKADPAKFEQLKRQYPEAEKFARDLDQLATKVYWPLKERMKGTYLTAWNMRKLNTPFDAMFSERDEANRNHEFLAWALTEPTIRSIMKQLYVTDDFQTAIGRVLDTTDTIPLHNKKLALKTKLNKEMSVWDKIVEGITGLVGMNTEQRYTKVSNRIRGYLEFMDTNPSTMEMLEKIVFPLLKESEGKYDPMLVTDAFNNLRGQKGGTIEKNMASFQAMPPKAREMAVRMVSPFKNWDELQKAMIQSGYKYKDLNKISGNFYPVSMVTHIADNPVVTFGTTRLIQIHGDSHALKKMFYDRVEEFFKAPKVDQNAVVTALNEINRPETQEILRNAGITNPVPSNILSHYGLNGNQITLYRKVLEPLFKALLAIDKVTIRIGFGRTLTSNVIGYYPRSFGFGRFSVTGFDPQTGEMKYYRRMPTFKEIRVLEEQLRAHGLHTERKVGKDFGEFKDHLLALIEIDPNSPVSKLADATIAASEAHRRTQEFERNAVGVAGFVGQQINNPKEIELLKTMIYHRIEQTVEAYRSARLIDEILRPMNKDKTTRAQFPEATQWIGDVIRREMGSDISTVKAFDNGILWLMNKAHIRYLKMFTKLAYDLKPGELTIDPRSNTEATKYATASSSAWALAGNIPNLITNFFAVPLVGIMGGWPDKFLVKAPVTELLAPAATKAHAQSLADMVLIATRQAGPELKSFVKYANSRGYIQANAFADLPRMRSNIEKGPVRKGIEAGLNVPRQMFNDPVEIATNFAAILFYRRFVDNLFPKLDRSDRFNLSIKLAKRYTGDYAEYNRALMFSKAGLAGHAMSNFAIWMLTRVGQFHEVLKNAVTRKEVFSLIAVMTAGIAVAGLQGAPGAQDYENIRQALYSVTKDSEHEIKLPPLDWVYKKAGVPEWLRNGVVLNMFGVDLASRGKWSGWTDLGGVTYTAPAKAFAIYDYIKSSIEGEIASETGTDASGPSIKTQAKLANAVPAAGSGFVRDELLTRHFRSDGKTNVLSQHGNSIYTRNPGGYEKWLNKLNFKTTGQAEEQRNSYNVIYEKGKFDKAARELKQRAVEQLVGMVDAYNQGNKTRGDYLQKNARANLIKLLHHSPTGLNTLRNDILNGIFKETDTPEEAIVKEMVKSKNGGRIVMLFNTLNTINGKAWPSASESGQK